MKRIAGSLTGIFGLIVILLYSYIVPIDNSHKEKAYSRDISRAEYYLKYGTTQEKLILFALVLSSSIGSGSLISYECLRRQDEAQQREDEEN